MRKRIPAIGWAGAIWAANISKSGRSEQAGNAGLPGRESGGKAASGA